MTDRFDEIRARHERLLAALTCPPLPTDTEVQLTHDVGRLLSEVDRLTYERDWLLRRCEQLREPTSTLSHSITIEPQHRDSEPESGR